MAAPALSFTAADVPALVRRLSAKGRLERLQAAQALGSLVDASARRRAGRSTGMQEAAVAAGAVKALVRCLEGGGEALAGAAAATLLDTLFRCPSAKEAFVAAGGVPRLLRLLRGTSSTDAQYKAVMTLGGLAALPAGARVVEAAGGIGILTQLLATSSCSDVQRAAAVALSRLSFAGCLAAVPAVIKAGAAPAVVRALQLSDRQAPTLAHMLHLLVKSDAAGPAMVAAGAIPALAAVLCGSDSEDVRAYAASALTSLTYRTHCEEAVLQAGAVPALVRLAGGDSEMAQQAAAGLLQNVACIAAGASAIVAAGGTAALHRLASGGSSAQVRQGAAAALKCMAESLPR